MTVRNSDAMLKLVRDNPPRGVISVCSAHPTVLEATLLRGLEEGGIVLIEATCNQVNQDGGYTGMTPAAFRGFVEDIAHRVGFPLSRLILGGDHLGPNPWRKLPADEAMAKADAMVAAYVQAGFRKIHLDCSMGCLGEQEALDDLTTSARAARLAAVAEAHAPDPASLCYVIGTEVPPPGGARHALDELDVTRPDAVAATYEAHREAFAKLGQNAAFERVLGLVVQPGVEFGNANVAIYKPERARELSRSLENIAGVTFEAHSTDYQPGTALRALVDDGFTILKVGPGLTFALREALYGLDCIEAALSGGQPKLMATVEATLVAQPGYWQGHYGGSDEEQRWQRHFSYSDRVRYYWGEEAIQREVDSLFVRLEGRPIPETLVSQYLGQLYPDVVSGRVPATARALCLGAVSKSLDPYYFAIRD